MKCFNNQMEYEVSLYTDGACSGNPGPGGYGAALIKNHTFVKGTAGRESNTTNNAMELRAIAEGLEIIDTPVTIYTDSNYAYQGIISWIWRWEQNGWKTSKGEPVKNRLLWERILSHLCEHPISVRKVKAHNGDKWNEFVDSMAQAQIRYHQQLSSQEKKCKKCTKYLPESHENHCEQYHTLYPEYIPCRFFELNS